LHADRAAFERYDFESGELTTSTVGEAARLITRPPG